MKLKTNLILDMTSRTKRRVWIDENCDLFVIIHGEKCVIEPTNYFLKLPGNIRYNQKMIN